MKRAGLRIKDMVTRRNYNLDLVKVLSCFAVVGMHIIHDDQVWLSSVIYHLCSFAIPCFFMASGYSLFNRENITWKYCLRKILGILRIVVLWNTMIYLANTAKDVYWGKFYQSGAIQYGLGYIKSILESLIQTGSLGQFWYLGSLILLYMLLPITSSYLNCKSYKNKKEIYVIVLLAISFLVQLTSYIVETPIQKYVIQTFRLWTWLMYFTIGGFVQVWFNKLKNKVPFRKHILLVLIMTIIVVCSRLAFLNRILHITASEYYYDSIMTVAWTVLLFTLILRIGLNPVAIDLVKIISPRIIGIYACHIAVRSIIYALVCFDGLAAQLIQTVMVSGISFAVSYVLSKLPFGKCFVEI